MSKPAGAWIVVFLLVAYGLFNVWLAASRDTGWFLLWTAACFIAAVGFFLSQWWSQFFVHLISSFTVFGWVVYVVFAMQAGWPYTWQSTVMISFHGTVLLAGSFFSSVYVYRYFRRPGAMKPNFSSSGREEA